LAKFQLILIIFAKKFKFLLKVHSSLLDPMIFFNRLIRYLLNFVYVLKLFTLFIFI
jgi:hypothetical protein